MDGQTSGHDARTGRVGGAGERDGRMGPGRGDGTGVTSGEDTGRARRKGRDERAVGLDPIFLARDANCQANSRTYMFF